MNLLSRFLAYFCLYFSSTTQNCISRICTGQGSSPIRIQLTQTGGKAIQTQALASESILFIHTNTNFRSGLHTVCVKHLIYMVLEITCITCNWWNDIRQSHKWAVHDIHLNFPAKGSMYQPDYVPYSFKCTTEIFLGESGKRQQLSEYTQLIS